MSQYFRRLFNRGPPAGLVEISNNILGACLLAESPFSLRYLVITLWSVWVNPARLLAPALDLFVQRTRRTWKTLLVLRAWQFFSSNLQGFSLRLCD